MIQDLCDEALGSIAMAVQLDDSTTHCEEDCAMAQVASKCKIVGFSVSKEDQVKVSLRCVGRVRLERMLQTYSSTHFQFSSSTVIDSIHHEQDKKT